MNVIMPTAMTTMHTDPTLSSNSAATAAKAKEVLACLLQDNDPADLRSNMNAIIFAATEKSNCSEDPDSNLVEYWKKFFDGYEYKEQQKEDIATAMSTILDVSEIAS